MEAVLSLTQDLYTPHLVCRNSLHLTIRVILMPHTTKSCPLRGNLPYVYVLLTSMSFIALFIQAHTKCLKLWEPLRLVHKQEESSSKGLLASSNKNTQDKDRQGLHLGLVQTNDIKFCHHFSWPIFPQQIPYQSFPLLIHTQSSWNRKEILTSSELQVIHELMPWGH